MKNRQGSLVVCVMVLSAATALGFLRPATSGVGMTDAAEKFVKSLSEEQRAKTLLAYDAPVRTDWHFIPKPTRKGLQIKEMEEPQRAAALELLKSALSEVGYGKATKIMQLESILRELE
jgi:hypothetical protein